MGRAGARFGGREGGGVTAGVFVRVRRACAGNNLGPEGGAALAEALKHNSTVHTLDLRGEWRGSDGSPGHPGREVKHLKHRAHRSGRLYAIPVYTSKSHLFGQ